MKIFFSRLCTSVVAACSLASGFGSVAQAGTWSGPPYVVSNRSPAADTTTTVPGGDGGGQNISGIGPVAGTVTARFTWVPDPNLANDPAPTKVYILEHGSASWSTGVLTRGGGKLQMEGMRPSTTEVSFSSARHPRFFYVQAQTSNGTANDGFGHAQVVAADGQSGSSSGYNVSSLTANGNEVTTAPVTLSASVAQLPNGLPNTSWGYSAKMLNVQLTRNGTDIADPKPEVPVMVGERNAMSVSISPLPADLPPLTYKWTLPTTDTIKDFTTTGQIPNPPTPGTTFTGHKVELSAEDSQIQSPHFYWYNGTFAGDSKDISVDVTIAGKTITLKGKCKVYRPKFTSFTATYTKQRPQSYYLGGGVRFGNPGVTFNATVQTPSAPNAAGSIAFEQLTTFNYARQGTNNGTPYSQTWSGSDTLDTPDNGVTYGNSIASIAAGNTANTTESDNPVLGTRTIDKTIQVSGSFKTYLVYKPNGNSSIWVVLGKLDWSFAFSAFYKDDDITVMPTWVATTTSPTDTTPNPVGSDTHDLPEWSMRGQDAEWTDVTP